MGGNTTKIDEVVDDVAIQQFIRLKSEGKELRTELSSLLQVAIDLTAALGGSTPATFAKSLKATDTATQNLIKTSQQLQDVKNREIAQQEKILNSYLVSLSKQESARQAKDARDSQRDAKEIAAAEAKQAKLDAIATRKASVQFPTSSTAPNPITDEPSTASTRYEPIITGNENMAIAANKSTESIAAENAALLEQQEVMDGLSTAYRANIELLLTLQVERAENAAALKALTVEDAASGERMVFLTAEQLRLKTAIQQTNLTLSQQTKQMLAADTSTAQNQARLDELRVAYNNLTVAEQENVAIGGIWLAEIERLDLAVKEAAVSQGIYNKNVGNYTVAADFAEKVSAKFYTQLVRLAAQFILITVIFGAITWLYDWIKNLDIFTGRLDKAKQAWEAWSEVVQESSKSAGKSIIELEVLNKAAQDINETDKERLAAVKSLRDLQGDRIKGISDEAIMTGALNDKIKELTTSLEKQAIAEAGFKKLTDIESQILDQKTLQGKLQSVKTNRNRNIDAGDTYDLEGVYFPGFSKMSKDAQKRVVADDIATQLKDVQETLDVLDSTKNSLEGRIGIKDLAKAAEKNTKPAKKTPKTKDTGNTDLLDFDRIKLEESKKINKAVFDNEENSYDVRKVALDKYLKDSKALIDNSNKIIDADTNLRAQQRINKKLEMSNKSKDIDIEAQAELEKLNKQEIEKKKKAVSDIVTLDKEQQQEQLEALNQGAIVAAQVLQNARDKAIHNKTLDYKNGKLTEKEYARDILAINDQFAIDRLNQELTVQRAILAIKIATRDKEVEDAKSKGATPAEIGKITSDANKGIDTTNNKIADIGGQLGLAIDKQDEDNVKGGKRTAAEKRKDLQDALGYAKDVTADIQDLIDKGYENQISKLEKIGQKIQENADIEKAVIDRSLDTQSNKARREEVLAAETASKQKEIQQQIAKEKHKQAVDDKAAAIAEIILNTAIGASKVIGQTGIFGIALEPLVIALGALQLAKVAATPIPQFAKGTPTGGHKGGYAIIGDGGGPERVTEPGKPAYYSPGVATMVSLPRGTVVEPYKMLPETPKWTSSRSDNSAVVDGLNRVERAVSGQKQGRARVQGWLSEQRQADAWNGYVGRRFK